MNAPTKPEECIVVVDPCEMTGDDSLCWDAVDSFATRARIERYAAAKVAEATEALRSENADLRARLAALARRYEGVHMIPAIAEAKHRAQCELCRALDLTTPFHFKRGT